MSSALCLISLPIPNGSANFVLTLKILKYLKPLLPKGKEERVQAYQFSPFDLSLSVPQWCNKRIFLQRNGKIFERHGGSLMDLAFFHAGLILQYRGNFVQY
jgi:hypothetical protein